MRKALSLATAAVVSLALTVNIAAATPQRYSASLQTPGTSRTLTLPPSADHAPVISLGTAVDPGSGQMVEGYAIVRYRNGKAKPGGRAARAPACYGFLAKGAKWKAVEPWVVNAANTRGLVDTFVLDNLAGDIAKWEDGADGVLGSGAGVNILGDGTPTTTTLLADTVSPDNVNEVYFADVADTDVIAVTIVWGIFSGPTFNRRLVEWDQVYDDVDFNWSAVGAAGAMDFESLATHELGHSVGLNDQYDPTCNAATMYGYASEGETNKRTLEAPDVTGVSVLY